jgi:hypothetical protein
MPGQSITGPFYVHILQRLCNAVWRKQHNKWQGQWFLFHNNTPSHTSLVMQQFLAEEHIPVIALWLYPTLKTDLKGTHFTTTEDIKSNTMVKLQKVPKEAFHQFFQQWQDRWNVCVCVCACVCVRVHACARKVIRKVLPYFLPLQCNTDISEAF